MAGMGAKSPAVGRARAIGAWAMYDFAVTIFAMNVTSRYFGLWLTEVKGGADWMYSLTFALSTGVAAVLMPWIGALSDRWGRRLPLLRVATLLCVAGTAAISWSPTLAAGLVAFAMANVGCQSGGLLYDALLPTVSEGRRVGWVSGIGVAMGYAGAITGLLTAQVIVSRYGYGAAFWPSAVLILFAALPICFLIRESPMPQRAATPPRAVLQDIWRLLIGPQRQPGLMRLFLSFFFGINAINTVIMFMAVYAKRTIGFRDAEIDLLLLGSTPFAFLGALLSGYWADRLGPRRCLIGVYLIWSLAVALAVAGTNPSWFWFIGPLIGLCLGGTWTTARAFLVALSPRAHLGLLFGLYGLIGRASSNIGPLLWGRITQERATLGALADRLALGSMLVLFLIGLTLMWGVPEATRQRATTTA